MLCPTSNRRFVPDSVEESRVTIEVAKIGASRPSLRPALLQAVLAIRIAPRKHKRNLWPNAGRLRLQVAIIARPPAIIAASSSETSRSLTFRGGGETFASHADNPDLLVGVKLPSNRAPGQIGLRTYEAGHRISELGGHAHHSVCVAARAVASISRRRSRANQH